MSPKRSMLEEGKVSLWAGTAKSKRAFERYVAFGYDDDGNAVPSAFMVDFKIGVRWDDDDREMDFFRRSESLHALLSRFSYGELQLVPQFETQLGKRMAERVNAVLLLFNFNYDGRVAEVKVPFGLKFFGVVSYEDEVFDVSILDD